MRKTIARSFIFGGALFLSTVSFVVFADGDQPISGPYYLTAAGSTVKYCLQDASYWQNSSGEPAGAAGQPLGDDDVFVICNGYGVNTPNSNDAAKSFAFSGAKLYVGDIEQSSMAVRKGSVTHHSGKNCVVDYGVDKLQLGPGSYTFGNASKCVFNVKGSITVVSTSQDEPGVFNNDSRYGNQDVNWTGDLKSGSASAYLRLGSTTARKESGDLSFTFRLLGSAASYTGTLEILAPNSSTTAPDFHTRFQCGGNFGGTLKMNAMTSLATPSCELTVADLNLSAGARLEIAGDFANHSSYVARSYEQAGVVEFLLSDAYALLCCDGDSHRMTLLTVPLGCNLSKQSFQLVAQDESACFLSLDVVKDATSEYLILVQEPVVVLRTTDVQSKDHSVGGVVPSSAFGSATSWSDGKVPHKDAHYYVRRLSGVDTDVTFARTPTQDYSFPGLSLTIGDHGLLLQCCQNLTVGTLRLLNGACLHQEQNTTTPVLRGDELWAQSGRVYVTAYNTRGYQLYSALRGKGEVFFNGVYGGSSRPDGALTICGETKDFAGSLTIGHYNLGVASAPYVSAYPGYFYIWNGVLDTAQETFNWRGIELGGGCEIRPRGKSPVTMNASANRGLYVNGVGSLNCDNQATYGIFTIDWPLTFNGVLTKKGTGALVLGGGEASFVDGDGVRGSSPVEGKNAFVISNGLVKVTAVDTLNGAAIRLADGATLEVAVDFEDEIQLRYGLRNVRTDMPFELIGGQSKLPLRYSIANTSTQKTQKRPFYSGVVTVSESAAGTVRGLMPPLPRPEGVRGYAMTPEERIENGMVTFGYRFDPSGVILVVR